MHIGKECEEYKCQKVSVDSWAEESVENENTTTSKDDKFDGEVEIEDSFH